MAGKTNMRNNKFHPNMVNRKNGTGIKKGDARLKIIQKKRSQLVDARDRLAQMAKKTDARAKILKLRQQRLTGVRSSTNETVRPVGTNILMKTDRNGKISLTTNRSNQNQTSINKMVVKALDLPRQRKVPLGKKQQPLQMTSLFKNSIETSRQTPYSFDVRVPPVIQRTIRNDMQEMIQTPQYPQSRPIDPNLYNWIRVKTPTPTPRQHPAEFLRQAVELPARTNFAEQYENWKFDSAATVRSIKLLDDDVEMEEPKFKTGIRARLDTPVSSIQSHGIFAQNSKYVLPEGHRIVVSNLQPTVTQDDIKELFEDIGELLVSRLVRPGTAEVVYKNLKDAQTAVETYHNRQLDGQPMKCLLVNKRPVNNPTAPAITSSSILRSSGGAMKKTITRKTTANTLVPDISTIHKVLFHK